MSGNSSMSNTSKKHALDDDEEREEGEVVAPSAKKVKSVSVRKLFVGTALVPVNYKHIRIDEGWGRNEAVVEMTYWNEDKREDTTVRMFRGKFPLCQQYLGMIHAICVADSSGDLAALTQKSAEIVAFVKEIAEQKEEEEKKQEEQLRLHNESRQKKESEFLDSIRHLSGEAKLEVEQYVALKVMQTSLLDRARR